MPVYTFKCPTGHTSDQLHPMAEKPVFVNCPTCGKPSRSIPSPAPVHFKGSGFYATDRGK